MRSRRLLAVDRHRGDDSSGPGQRPGAAHPRLSRLRTGRTARAETCPGSPRSVGSWPTSDKDLSPTRSKGRGCVDTSASGLAACHGPRMRRVSSRSADRRGPSRGSSSAAAIAPSRSSANPPATSSAREVDHGRRRRRAARRRRSIRSTPQQLGFDRRRPRAGAGSPDEFALVCRTAQRAPSSGPAISRSPRRSGSSPQASG